MLVYTSEGIVVVVVVSPGQVVLVVEVDVVELEPER